MSLAVCLFVAGTLAVRLPAGHFTLAWTHSIELTRWEEDWSVDESAEPPSLRIDAARIRSSGAGMEIPDDAVLRDGAWHYAPTVRPLARLRLSHSPYAAPYELCLANGCRTLDEILPERATATVVEIAPCI